MLVVVRISHGAVKGTHTRTRVVLCNASCSLNCQHRPDGDSATRVVQVRRERCTCNSFRENAATSQNHKQTNGKLDDEHCCLAAATFLCSESILDRPPLLCQQQGTAAEVAQLDRRDEISPAGVQVQVDCAKFIQLLLPQSARQLSTASRRRQRRCADTGFLAHTVQPALQCAARSSPP